MIQSQVINHILDSRDASIITLNNLTKDYFSDYTNEYNYIMNHLKTYGSVPDKATFLSVFPDFDLFEVNEPQRYLLDALVKEHRGRQMRICFNQIRPYLESGDTEKAEAELSKLFAQSSDGVTIQSVDIFKDTSRYDEFVEKSQDLGKYYISTGFKELDALIGGWDRHEELAIIAGRTNTGKSYLTLKMVLSAVEQGLTVGLYSGEMTANKVGYRLDTLATHISNGALIHGNEKVTTEYKRYMETMPTRFKGSLKILTPKSLNGPAGVSTLGAFIEKDHLDILFIDQHSLLEDDRHAKTPVEKASNISKDLKNLQTLKQIPIIAISQLNRTTTDDNIPDMSQIAQADRIGQDCTCALFIERSKTDDSVLKLHLVKSRDSVNNKCLSYAVDFNQGTFDFIEDENSALTDDKVQEYESRYAKHEDSGEDVF